MVSRSLAMFGMMMYVSYDGSRIGESFFSSNIGASQPFYLINERICG